MPEITARLTAALAERYAIQEELGAGGMATVYLAEDLKHHRKVAVKVLRPELAAVVGAERFLNEIQIAAQLNHPHILTLIDSGEADGFLYYVMPYVQGESLRERLGREKQLSIDDALTITQDIAGALGHAHAQGVIHRDIKPANILMHEGKAVVADFGIALALHAAGGERLTETGLSLGTPEYMSPEQATADHEVDARSDLYSLAALLYEMLAGEPPHRGHNTQAIIAKLLTERPTPLPIIRDTIPEALNRAVMKGLAKVPADRFATGVQFVEALTMADAEQQTGPTMTRPAPLSFPPLKRLIPAALAVLALAAVGAGWWMLSAPARRASKALLTIRTLVENQDFVAADRLARDAEPTLGNDPEFRRLWQDATVPVSIETTPSGADISITDYDTPEGDWISLGTSPIESARIPGTYLRWKFEKAGFEPSEQASAPISQRTLELHFALFDTATAEAGMIRVPAGVRGRGMRLSEFWLDRYEVTNAQFLQFVDQGGYQSHEYWEQLFDIDGGMISWEEATDSLVDPAGRHGPSTWEVGRYREGEKDFPVRGVSWYEAAAYCKFAGKALPTAYHWYAAAGSTLYASILLQSNFGERPAPVGQHTGIGPYGHYDMAGNVREWVWNRTNRTGTLRYILGGSWEDPRYMFGQLNAAAPLDRSPRNGFRCMKYADELPGAVTDPAAFLESDYDRQPVQDDVFEAYRALYSYDSLPLNEKVESVDSTSPYWYRETITFDAAYAQERVIAQFFLPKNKTPPFQVVVYYPAADADLLQSLEDMHTRFFDFIVRDGRAVMYPVYKGTFVRQVQRSGANALRDLMIQQSKDMQRSIDYLETRVDIDSDRIGYYGFSSGGIWAPLFMTVESRFKVCVLLSGGFWGFSYPSAIEPMNFIRHTTTPMLMVNGEYDLLFPPDRGQLPFMRLWGAPGDDKRRVTYEGGHVPTKIDWPLVMTETLNWLDRYLGPVR